MARRYLSLLAVTLLVLASCGGGGEGETGSAGDTSAGEDASPEDAPEDGADAGSGESGDGSGDSSLRLAVKGVEEGGEIPIELTCDGANMAPVVTVSGVPDDAAALALIVDDPDAPTPEPFVHWVLAGIPPGAGEITDGDPALVAGANGSGEEGWTGPCPPEGDGPHTYRWTLFALDDEAGMEAGIERAALEETIQGSVIAKATFSASYERAG